MKDKMKSKIVNLTGDIHAQLYQLGLAEKESFLVLEKRATRLLSASSIMSSGQDIISRAKTILKKRKEDELSFFDSCVKSYAEGLGIDLARYLSFLSLFEMAAHYGQAFPELKSLIPGCTSLLRKTEQGMEHSRLIDFPLVGILDEKPRLYYWKVEGRPTILSFSCEGLAPLFFHTIHQSGFSMALHYKPGTQYHQDGKGIFQMAFEMLFEAQSFADIRKVIKKQDSVTKWSFILLENSGKVEVYDIDGPTLHQESYHLNESQSLIFTNIPLKQDDSIKESFVQFCHQRQSWLKDKISKKSKEHVLDLLTDVKDQKNTKWLHPASTLSTTGALSINLTSGIVDIKEGEGALVAGDRIIRYSLADQKEVKLLKPQATETDFDRAWKHASKAQSYFDQGEFDEAYHHLQMAEALIPLQTWKQILDFYLCVWDFKFVKSTKELNHIYKRVKKLELPPILLDQKSFLLMRLERKLNLLSSIRAQDISPSLRDNFEQEKKASKPVFSAQMALLYPRLEILDVISPHLR